MGPLQSVSQAELQFLGRSDSAPLVGKPDERGKGRPSSLFIRTGSPASEPRRWPRHSFLNKQWRRDGEQESPATRRQDRQGAGAKLAAKLLSGRRNLLPSTWPSRDHCRLIEGLSERLCLQSSSAQPAGELPRAIELARTSLSH